MRDDECKAANRMEERRHELTMLQMLEAATQNSAVNTFPTAFQRSNYLMVPLPNSVNMH